MNHRRKFLKQLAAAGVAGTLPAHLLSKEASGQERASDGASRQADGNGQNLDSSLETGQINRPAAPADSGPVNRRSSSHETTVLPGNRLLQVNEPIFPRREYSVLDFGGIGDGKTLETAALQKTIDSCAANGGGTVRFPAGVYLSGTLFLRSSIRIHLDRGAIIMGSPNLEDYPQTIPELRSYTDNYTVRSLLYAENCQNIAITGPGIIDGQGALYPVVRHPYKDRPYILRMVSCHNLLIEDIVFLNSPMWVQHYLGCDHLRIRNIAVYSRRANLNNDGINIDACHHVHISGCDIDAEDDAIVFKSTLNRRVDHALVEHCSVSSICNGLKFGTESNGGFSNVLIRNCRVYNTRLSGLALEVVDGGVMENIRISGITMDRVNNPIFIRLGNRARPYREDMEPPGPGSLSKVSIEYVKGTNLGYYREDHPFKNLPAIEAHIPSSISGLSSHPVRQIRLRHVDLVYESSQQDPFDFSKKIPEAEKNYPEYHMFGPLPAYGFYLRHAEDIHFDRVRVRTLRPDSRPEFFLDRNTRRIFRDGSMMPSKD